MAKAGKRKRLSRKAELQIQEAKAYNKAMKKRILKENERGALIERYMERNYWAINLLDFGWVPMVFGSREWSDDAESVGELLMRWFREEIAGPLNIWFSDGAQSSMIAIQRDRAFLFHTEKMVSEGTSFRLANTEDDVARLLENLAATTIARLMTTVDRYGKSYRWAAWELQKTLVDWRMKRAEERRGGKRRARQPDAE